MNDPISTTVPSRSEQDDDEINLGEYALIVWRYRLAIVMTTLLSGVAAFVVTSRAQPVYEATAQLVVNQSKMGDQAVIQAMPSLIASYKALLDNHSLAARIVKEFGLDKPPRNLTALAFQAGALSSDVVRDTNVITIKVRLPDSMLAAGVANRYAELTVDLAQRLSRDETAIARDIIKTQLDQSTERLAEAEDKLQRFKKEAQIDLVKEDVRALLGERGRLVALMVEIEGERARLSKAEQEFAKQVRVRSEPSALDIGGDLRQIAREAQRGTPEVGGDSRRINREDQRDSGAASGMQLRGESISPFINPVYEILNEQIAMSRTKLAGLEKQQAQLVGVLRLGAPQMVQLTQLYEKETQLARLETEFDLAKKVYVDVATRYEQARVQVASRTAQLQILDSALPPDRPISPRPLRDTAIALLVGLLLSIPGVLLFDFITSAYPRPVAR
jgi:polysaccharide biosynthesis transport protein